ncbi:MAG TPA: hypothetical protein VGY56_15495 [Verrucomicrobiae bacterium]|nr:hypothetical protein [Verrucomicrobiae bacterium]
MSVNLGGVEPGVLAGEAQGQAVLLAMVEQHALITLQHGPRHVLGARDAPLGQRVNEPANVKPVVVQRAWRVVARLQPAVDKWVKP